MRRLSALIAAAAAATVLLPGGVAAHAADDFPAKPVTLVTPFAAGSGPDAVLRLVAEKLGKQWNQRITIDNKPGGGGFIAIDAARRAAPDGSTLLQLDSEHLAALPHLYARPNDQAVRHAFRVASGLDSMVLGEPQILGQLKQAYRIAQDARTLSGPLEQLLQRSFSVAKNVRTETRLGANAVSVAFAAVRLATQVFDEMPKRQALLVGAGETIELVARHLVGAGVRRTIVVNRTLERARALADRIGGQAARLSELETHLADCDILVTATHGNDPVIGKDAVKRAFAGRRRRPLFAVDLGVPRNIEAGVGDLDEQAALVHLALAARGKTFLDKAINET
mgnify:CR=1 FL=1